MAQARSSSVRPNPATPTTWLQPTWNKASSSPKRQPPSPSAIQPACSTVSRNPSPPRPTRRERTSSSLMRVAPRHHPQSAVMRWSPPSTISTIRVPPRARSSSTAAPLPTLSPAGARKTAPPSAIRIPQVRFSIPPTAATAPAHPLRSMPSSIPSRSPTSVTSSH